MIPFPFAVSLCSSNFFPSKFFAWNSLDKARYLGKEGRGQAEEGPEIWSTEKFTFFEARMHIKSALGN